MCLFKKKEEPKVENAKMTRDEFVKQIQKYLAVQYLPPIEMPYSFHAPSCKSIVNGKDYSISYDLQTKCWSVASLYSKVCNSSLEFCLIRLLQEETNVLHKRIIENNLSNSKQDRAQEIWKVIHNKEKSTTVVWFCDKSKVVVKRIKGAKDDVYTAVAFALAKKKYFSNSWFKRIVDGALNDDRRI